MLRKWKTAVVALSLLVVAVGVAAAAASGHRPSARDASGTATRIKHLVVIFQENVSFDHYFGTYPHVNGLNHDLLTHNPNGVNPRRYDPSNLNDILTCDQDHDYNDEQKAFDGGKMDKFVTSVGTGTGKSPTGQPCNANDVMNYYDGKTVTALWNYAKTFSMSDNSFGTTFGPSSPGAINLVSGDTGDVGQMINGADTDGDTVPDGKGGRSLISDAQPYYDDCSTRDAASLTGKNIGDELNAAGLSWGWFQGGFRPTTSTT